MQRRTLRTVVVAVQRGWQQTLDAMKLVDWEAFALHLVEYQQLMPSNLTAGTMARINSSRDSPSAIPLAWVVPSEIAAALVYEYSTDDERIAFILQHQEEILDQCQEVLAPLDFPAARAALESVECLRAGLAGPAQSHATNVVDSVVLGVFSSDRPASARKKVVRLGQTSFPGETELSVRAFVERVVLSPLGSAYVQWYPESGEDPPTGFGRHATSHAAHIEGVFSAANALIAVMLACSLVAHYNPYLSEG